MRGVGNVGRCAPGLQLVVESDHGLQFAGIETVEYRNSGVFQLGIGDEVRISFDHFIGQPWIGVERTEHRRDRLRRCKHQRRIPSSEYAVYGMFDFPYILMQQHLLAFQILEVTAWSPDMKGRPSRRFFCIPGQVWNLKSLRRTSLDRVHEHTTL